MRWTGRGQDAEMVQFVWTGVEKWTTGIVPGAGFWGRKYFDGAIAALAAGNPVCGALCGSSLGKIVSGLPTNRELSDEKNVSYRDWPRSTKLLCLRLLYLLLVIRLLGMSNSSTPVVRCRDRSRHNCDVGGSSADDIEGFTLGLDPMLRSVREEAGSPPPARLRRE